MTLGSLFDGSGGFPLAGTLAGIKPVWASEIEPFPIRVTTKRFPDMLHFGDISKINGAEISPVDIITFGSPCQDLSAAGKRKGLSGERSGLFMEAIRIIKEMRAATNGIYPRYIVWENVPGAYSSNKGEDFRTVLSEIVKIKDETISIPKSDKWLTAGEILGNDYSIAWRTFDAQYWGVPQRRRRIFLVADFRGSSSGKVLFERESLLGDIAASFKARQKPAGDTGICSKRANNMVYAIGNGQANGLGLHDKPGALNCTHDAQAIVCAEFSGNTGAKAGNIGYANELSPTLKAGQEIHVAHSAGLIKCYDIGEARLRTPREYNNISPTLSARCGTGGNNVPAVVHSSDVLTYDARGNGDGATVNTITGDHENRITDYTALCVFRKGTRPHNKHEAQIWEKCETANTINTFDIRETRCNELIINPAYSIDRAAFNQGENAQYAPQFDKEISQTIVAKGPNAVALFVQKYIIRRFTPLECCRLQGFPDFWCTGLETPNPSEEDIAFWAEVFETHRRITNPVNKKGNPTKPKTRNQIIKWLKNPYSDSAEYKMWGNGVALPCAYNVLAGIASELNNKAVLYER